MGIDSLRLAGVTGNSYSLIEMKTGAFPNNLAFVKQDMAREGMAIGSVINQELFHSHLLVFGRTREARVSTFQNSDIAVDQLLAQEIVQDRKGLQPSISPTLVLETPPFGGTR